VVDGTLPLDFYCVSISRKDFTFDRKRLTTMHKFWAAALLEGCDIIQDGGHIGCHLGFHQQLEIIKKRRKLKIFDVDLYKMT